MTLTLAVLIAAQLQGWQSTVDSLARNGEFSGVVLVARNGVPQFERAYGMADPEAGRANTIATALRGGRQAQHRLQPGPGVARLPQPRSRAKSHNPADPRASLGNSGQHLRGAPGLNAVLEGGLAGGYDVIVLANLDPPAAERVGRLIRAALTSP